MSDVTLILTASAASAGHHGLTRSGRPDGIGAREAFIWLMIFPLLSKGSRFVSCPAAESSGGHEWKVRSAIDLRQ